MFEMNRVKLTKQECAALAAGYTDVDVNDVENVIAILIKLGVISEYVFEEPQKAKTP